MAWTDEPALDAECYNEEMECRRKRSRRGRCAICGGDINSFDDYYNVYGELLCDDCLLDWAAQFRNVEGIT